MNYTQISDPDCWRKLIPQLSISEKIGKQSISLLSMSADKKRARGSLTKGILNMTKQFLMKQSYC
jgi:hypothetical protein